MCNLEGLVWSVVLVSFSSPAFHLVSGGDVNRTIYKAGEQNPWQSLKPQPPLLVSWASPESLCNWQCLLEQWSNTKKTAGNGRLDFPESTCWTQNGRDGIEISQLHSFDDSNVDRSDVLPWSPSPRANFLGKKSAFEVVDPGKRDTNSNGGNGLLCSMPWKWWCVARLWLWWRKPCQESHVIQVHHETLSDLTHWVSLFIPCLQVFQSSSYQ